MSFLYTVMKWWFLLAFVASAVNYLLHIRRKA